MKSVYPNRRKRTREEIVASILDSARYGATKTRIMYVSFLSYSQLQRYLGIALESKLIGLDPKDRKYLITNKGLEYLKRFEELHGIENSVVTKRKLLAEILSSTEG